MESTKKSKIDLLKEAIQELHDSGSGDWDSLFRQAGKPYNALERNAAQVRFFDMLPFFKKITCVWSRATGKTFTTADLVAEIRRDMPRCVIAWEVPSYKKFRKEILPSFKRGMELMGYFEGLHYVIGTRPNKKWKWDTPTQSPDDWTNVVSFPEGTIIQVISQDIEGAGRGLNVDVIIKDEGLMLDKVKSDENTAATLRGSDVRKFENCKLFGHDVTFSSMPITQGGKWLLDGERLAREFPKTFYYSMFNCGVNIRNLRKGYLEDAAKVALYKWLFEAEFLNVVPNLVMDSYYSLLSELKHAYYPIHNDFRVHDNCSYDYALDDLWTTLPLIVGIDWGSRINYMVVCQLRDEGEGLVLRCLNEFWALGQEGEIQQDMIKKFTEYYAVFTKKNLFLFYDRQGNNKTGLTKETRAQQAVSQLTLEGWEIESMSKGGANPAKSFNRLLWENVLKEDDRRLPKLRINKHNCPKLLISMQNAQTKTLNNKEITKNKNSERPNSGVHPTEATDPSDSIDHVIEGICGDDFKYGELMPYSNL